MLYPDPDNIDSPSRYVVVDFNRPLPPITTADVILPVYPESGDMLEVCGENGEIWYADVLSVDTKKIPVKYTFMWKIQVTVDGIYEKLSDVNLLRY